LYGLEILLKNNGNFWIFSKIENTTAVA